MSSFFSSVSPKTNFFLGIGSALGVFFIVGFFVLLFMVLNDSPNSTATQQPVNTNVQGGQQGNPSSIAPVTKDDWSRGPEDARITIVEFSDTECPFCQKFHPELQKLIATYPDDVRWVYRHYPLVSLHSKAPKEAEATECAGELGGNDGFWKFIDRMYEVTPANNGLDPAQLPQIAEEVGLDRDAFTECLSSGKYAQKVQSQVSEAVNAGGQGTPYSVILVDDQIVPVSGYVPFEQLQSFVESVLAS